jgi:transposase-like protein
MATTLPAIDLIPLLDTSETDAQCRAYLEDLRWPTGPICPRCSGKVISRIKARKVFECDDCCYQFSVTAGTLFHDSHLPLPKWFLAIFLLCESKEGMSALQLKRLLKVSYKTAWYLCHRIRAAMTETNPRPQNGTVEADETTIGSGRGLQPGIESAFSLFKRAMVGSFHRVSEKHLDRYLDEFEFRFNNRRNPYLFRDTLLRLIDSKAMPYETLTA